MMTARKAHYGHWIRFDNTTHEATVVTEEDVATARYANTSGGTKERAAAYVAFARLYQSPIHTPAAEHVWEAV